MADRHLKPATTASVKGMFISILGLAIGFKYLRALWRRSRIAIIARAVGWGTATRPRRLLVFEAISDWRSLVARAIAFELDLRDTRLLRISALLNKVEDLIDIRNMAVGSAQGELKIQHRATAMTFGDHRVRATFHDLTATPPDAIPLQPCGARSPLRPADTAGHLHRSTVTVGAPSLSMSLSTVRNPLL
jgi:hypothetical protein